MHGAYAADARRLSRNRSRTVDTRLSLIGLFTLLSSAAACAVDSSDGATLAADDSQERVGETDQRYVTAFEDHSVYSTFRFSSPTFPWSKQRYQQTSTKTLGNYHEKFCFLTGIVGAFDGSKESVKLSIGSDDQWRLTVATEQVRTLGYASCVKWSDFTSWGGTAIAPVVSRPAGWSIHHGGGNIIAMPVSTPLWDHRSFCFLSGVRGSFDGGDEWLSIQEDGKRPFDLWRLSARATSGGETWGDAMCANFGNGRVPSYADPGGTEYTWTSSNRLDVKLANSGAAVCFLTGVRGKFGSLTEARIYRDTTGAQWLHGQEGAVSASARCLHWAQ